MDSEGSGEMDGGGDDPFNSQECPNCGQTYYEPVDDPATPGYLWECHLLFECPNPDQMEKARMNASGQEINEVWP